MPDLPVQPRTYVRLPPKPGHSCASLLPSARDRSREKLSLVGQGRRYHSSIITTRYSLPLGSSWPFFAHASCPAVTHLNIDTFTTTERAVGGRLWLLLSTRRHGPSSQHLFHDLNGAFPQRALLWHPAVFITTTHHHCAPDIPSRLPHHNSPPPSPHVRPADTAHG